VKPKEDAVMVASNKTPPKASAVDIDKQPVQSATERAVAAKIEDKQVQETELKSTSKPTSAPTFEAVQPRKNGKRGKKSADEAAQPDARTAQPTASGERSLIRALGLKIGKIVIDA